MSTNVVTTSPASSFAQAALRITNAPDSQPEELQLRPATGTGTSAVAEVPEPPAPAVQPPISMLPANEALSFLGIKPNIKEMTLDEKFTCLKQCFAYGYGVRKVLCEVFESIRSEVKTYAKDRAGMPNFAG